MSTPETGAGWFPRINAQGQIVCAGLGEVWIVGRPQKVATGFGPDWNGTGIVYGVDAKPAVTQLLNLTTGLVTTVPAGYNERHGGARGQWAGARPGFIQRYVEAVPFGAALVGNNPRLSANGRFAYTVQGARDTEHALIVDGREVAHGPITQIAIDDLHVAWVVATSTYGRAVYVDGVLASFGKEEAAALFDGWLLTYAEDRFLIRPVGDDRGYVWVTSNAYAPDVRIINGQILIAASTSKGEFFLHPIDPTSPRVSLRTIQVPVPPVQPAPAPVPPVTPTIPETPTMRLPDGVQQIVNTLYAQHLDLANGTDDQRRDLTQLIIEQVVYAYPNDGWVWKSADPGRPLSKDSIAKQQDGRLLNFDLFNGSTRKPNDHPESDDITGQTPRPWPGVDHLGASQPPVQNPEPGTPNPGPGTPPASDILTLLHALQVLYERSELRLQSAEDRLSELEQRPMGGGAAPSIDGLTIALKAKSNGQYLTGEPEGDVNTKGWVLNEKGERVPRGFGAYQQFDLEVQR